MLPAPRTSHKHERDRDAYASPPGAVPGQASNERITRSEPLKRELTDTEKQQQLAIRTEAKTRAERYDKWLDALISLGGDKIKALQFVYEIGESDARARQYELEIDVRLGMAQSDIGELLDKNNISTAAQAKILGKWSYSDNPAASINAIKLVQEMQGDTKEVGSFESFLRLSKAQSGK